MVGLRCCVDKEHCNRNVGVERWPVRLAFGAYLQSRKSQDNLS
jgi:hypothetical protein